MAAKHSTRSFTRIPTRLADIRLPVSRCEPFPLRTLYFAIPSITVWPYSLLRVDTAWDFEAPGTEGHEVEKPGTWIKSARIHGTVAGAASIYRPRPGRS